MNRHRLLVAAVAVLVLAAGGLLTIRSVDAPEGRGSTQVPPVSPPLAEARPDAGNTGVPAGTKLTRRSGNVDVTTDGSVVDGLDIEEGINVKADNVIIRRVRARCTSGGGGGCITILPGHTGTRIEDTEVGGGADGTTYTGTDIGIVVGANGSAPADTTTLTRVHVHHTADGLRSDGSVTVTGSYIHHLDPAPGQHGDGSQSTGWSNMVFRHNTIVGGFTSAIYLNRERGNPDINNVVIDDNWLEGAPDGATAYPLYVNDGTANVTVTNNRFNRSGYRPAFDRPGTAITTWKNNTWVDTGALIAEPAKGS